MGFGGIDGALEEGGVSSVPEIYVGNEENGWNTWCSFQQMWYGIRTICTKQILQRTLYCSK